MSEMGLGRVKTPVPATCIEIFCRNYVTIFVEPEIELARKAADLMGLNVYDGETPNLSKALKTVPKGRVYASGWGFVPYIRWSLFDGLLKAIGVTAPKPPKTIPQPKLPSSWDSIDAGHLVLAQADSAANG